MLQTVCQPHRRQALAGHLLRIGAPGQLKGHGDILERGHRRDQVKSLEDDPHMIAAETCQRVLVERSEVVAVDAHRPGARPLDAGDGGEQGRFARTRRPDHAQRLAALDAQGDAAQNGDRAGGAGEGEMDVVESDHDHAA